MARGLAEVSGKRIRLSTKAIVGATSKGLSGQVDAMFVAGPPPDAGDTDAFELRRRRIEQLPLEYRDLVRRYFRALERARAEEAGGES